MGLRGRPLAPDRRAIEEARRCVQTGSVADGGEADEGAFEIAPRLAGARLGELRERPGDAPRGGVAQESGADVRRLSDAFPHGLSERCQELRIRQAGGGPAVAGGKKTAKEVVARGRQARAQADKPRRRAAHGVEAPARRRRQGPARPASTAPPWRRRRRCGQQRRDAQVGRCTLLQRFQLRHAGAPALAVASKRRGRPCGEPARGGAIHPQTAAPGRPLEHDLVGGEDAAVARHEPKRGEVLGEASRTPRGKSSASALSSVRRSPSGALRFSAARKTL